MVNKTARHDTGIESLKGEALEVFWGLMAENTQVEILQAAINKAKKGDIAALRLLLPYLLGQPKQQVDMNLGSRKEFISTLGQLRELLVKGEENSSEPVQEPEG